MRSHPLLHHDVRAGIPKCVRPTDRVVEEERLEGARNQVRPWDALGEIRCRSESRARGAAEHRPEDVRMPQPERDGEFPTRRRAEDRRALGGQRDAESRPHPPADILTKNRS